MTCIWLAPTSQCFTTEFRYLTQQRRMVSNVLPVLANHILARTIFSNRVRIRPFTGRQVPASLIDLSSNMYITILNNMAIFFVECAPQLVIVDDSFLPFLDVVYISSDTNKIIKELLNAVCGRY